MTAKRKKRSGRVTPKGTKNPTKTSRARRADTEAEAETPAYVPPHELSGKAGKQSGKVARPLTHNRGNR